MKGGRPAAVSVGVPDGHIAPAPPSSDTTQRYVHCVQAWRVECVRAPIRSGSIRRGKQWFVSRRRCMYRHRPRIASSATRAPMTVDVGQCPRLLVTSASAQQVEPPPQGVGVQPRPRDRRRRPRAPPTIKSASVYGSFPFTSVRWSSRQKDWAY